MQQTPVATHGHIASIAYFSVIHYEMTGWTTTEKTKNVPRVTIAQVARLDLEAVYVRKTNKYSQQTKFLSSDQTKNIDHHEI
jgi:hypothetical protein